VALDSYYLDLSGIPIEERDRRNFDAPEALDWDFMIPQLTELAGGGAIDKPVYRFATHTRAEETVRVTPSRFVVVEGLLALCREEIRNLCRTTVFVSLDDEACFSRRLRRDISERARSVESIFEQYNRTVRPMAERHVNPTRAFAHVVVSGASPVADMAAAVMDHIRARRTDAAARA
jgi:uridine kinase